MSAYVSGQTVELRCAFTDADGDAMDPTDVLLRLRPPRGADQVYSYSGTSITQLSTGLYRARVTLAVVGVWLYRWEGTGPLHAVAAGQLTVLQDLLA